MLGIVVTFATTTWRRRQQKDREISILIKVGKLMFVERVALCIKRTTSKQLLYILFDGQYGPEMNIRLAF